MTELRDAIREAAQAAVQPAWRRRWQRMGDRRLPWMAALAAIALAALLAVLWEGRQVPGPRRERAAEVASPIPAPAASAVSEAASDAVSGRVALPAPLSASPELPPASAAAAPTAAASAPPVTTLPPPRPRDLARAAPAPVVRAASSPTARLASRPVPASEVARLAAAPPVPAAPPAAPPPPALRASPAPLPWTQVRIEAGGRSVVIARMQAGELPALVTSMLASASDEAEGTAAASLRLELAQGDEAIGVLELVGERWRWTTLRDARQARLLRPEAGVSAALREEAQRLLAR